MNFYLLLQKVQLLKILIMAKIYSTYKALETPKKKDQGFIQKTMFQNLKNLKIIKNCIEVKVNNFYNIYNKIL